MSQRNTEIRGDRRLADAALAACDRIYASERIGTERITARSRATAQLLGQSLALLARHHGHLDSRVSDAGHRFGGVQHIGFDAGRGRTAGNR